MKKIIIGSGFLSVSALEQYKRMNFAVEAYDDEGSPSDLAGCDELFVALPQCQEDPFRADSENVARILPLLATYSPVENGGRKLLCHLLLHSQSSVDVFRTACLDSELNDKIEIWPFTVRDICARRIVFDRQPIPADSESVVHLVIFGMTQLAESIANTAALVCHYPNYLRNHSLRTRITVIDEDISRKSAQFISRNRILFDNSYTRFVDLDAERSNVVYPQYSRTREDFVDIEWEFVNGSPDSAAVASKIEAWSADAHQQLSIALCHESDEVNMSFAEILSGKINDIPIYVKVCESSIFKLLRLSKNIIPISTDSAEYDVSLPERRMAKIVNFVYSQAYASSSETVMTPAEIDLDAADQAWEALHNPALRWSSVCNALSIRSKMHSLGHDESEWTTFYSVSAREIEAIAEVEHNRWCVEKLMAGFRPLTDDEMKMIADDPKMKIILKEKKAHFDLRSYSELGRDETGKNARVYDLCLSESIPLIASASNIKNVLCQ